METWSRGLERFNTARAKYSPSQFYDVDYKELIADPMGTVADIYRHFGMTLTEEAKAAMERPTPTASPARGRPSTRTRWPTTA